ncbi:hypothetical protein BJ965_002175 [Streptomyces luteogriseus]|uniref:Uncharacterized protein n=1 Tax=Streptomyces luteogriseus TaxID=68233 RepID=A0A7W7GHE5_9ACTN|nr:hypothetical protein [Streptomyces luteogriseus]MBB4712293.1 hypothetical protein [Streptomyces luteogriseus]
MARQLQPWWIDPALPGCEVGGSGRSGMTSDEITLKNLAEFSHAHADYRIKNHQNAYDRIDAILALKRSMQTRLEHLDRLYGFKQYPEFKQLGPLGLLDHWGVIRRRMLHRMRQLRNAVEHDGAEPPSLDNCEDYAEVTWWFLRGTSPLLQPMENVDYLGEFHGDITYTYRPLQIRISGDVTRDLISDSERSGWSKLKTETARYGAGKGEMTPVENGDGRYLLEANVAGAEWAHDFLRHAFRQLL